MKVGYFFNFHFDNTFYCQLGDVTKGPPLRPTLAKLKRFG